MVSCCCVAVLWLLCSCCELVVVWCVWVCLLVWRFVCLVVLFGVLECCG